jgi:hypothetical protein
MQFSLSGVVVDDTGKISVKYNPLTEEFRGAAGSVST